MSATLVAGGVAYFVSGAKAAIGCIAVGLIIAVVLHFTGRKEKKEEIPVIKDAQIKDSFNPKFKQEANPQFHLYIGPENNSKPVPIAPPPTQRLKPNLQYRREYPTRMWVGHEISGHSADVFAVEIGNELGERVGRAEAIRAHVTYKNNNGETLQTLCPARWIDQSETVYLEVGEGGSVVLAMNRGVWFSREYDGIDLRKCSEIQLRLLDKDGAILGEPIILHCRFGGAHEIPVSKKH